MPFIVTSSDQKHRAASNDQNIWDGFFTRNTEKRLYSSTISHAVPCVLQEWGLCLIFMGIVINLVVLLVYVVVAYRVWSKRLLMGAMDDCGKACPDLDLQSTSNTFALPSRASIPGKSPYAVFTASLRLAKERQAEPSIQFASAHLLMRPMSSFLSSLQGRDPSHCQQSMPKQQQGQLAMVSVPKSRDSPTQIQVLHVPAAPGETIYGSVPIPGPYSSPMVP
ncbi:hypothetical protein N7539_008706 [Penicillium diatomitis]|uniref:Uncharacterized protein n=1 Tax=Penicillium diatomitis TaxID=2819901 RepID=A0A9W9WR35_9EURO|nr:uncharacterized protein N7539_008706 [Penicillium diatomitis]KAJ5472137.1 hypothetical protein N7539_008706 [Penicillium diatomitis]